MKSIILVGASRSGKTTLARRLQKETGFSLISGDALMCTFEAIYPELGISHQGDRETVCRNWEDFIVVYLNHLTEYEHVPLIFDTFHLLPEQVSRLKLHEKYQVVFVGYPNITAEEKLNNIRQFRTDHYDWTDEHSDEDLLKDIKEFIAYSQMLQKECAAMNLNFINTSHNFKDALETAYQQCLQRT
jgi:uridine kinase